MEKIISIGLSGHAHSIIESIIQKNKYKIVSYVDSEEHDNYLVIKYLGDDNELKNILYSWIKNAVVCIGFMGNNNNRELIYN